MDLNFRKLRADEIEARVGIKSKQGDKVCMLLYKDARCDMAMLDETVGAMNWQREHLIRENIIEEKKVMVNYCKVSIWDKDKGVWVSKEDCGVESNTEMVKGESSDAFKRACFSWGIGRELYSAPKDMWVTLNQGEDPKYFRLYCKEIGYAENGDINKVVLIDKFGKERYSFGTGAKRQAAPLVQTAPQQKSQAQIAQEYLATNPRAKQYYIDMYNANHANVEGFVPVTDTSSFNEGTWVGVYASLKKNNKI